MDDGAETSTPPSGDKTRPPVVLQVLPSLVTGGVERGTVDVAAALVAAGWRAFVASAGGPMVHDLERAGAVHLAMPVDSKNPVVMRRNVDRLARAISQHGVDIVHARSRAPAWSARAACARTGAHFVTTFHGTYAIGSAPKRWYNAVMTKGERVIAISRFISDHILREYAVDPRIVRVIHRGIDLDRFDPQRVTAARVIQMASEWRLPDGVPVVLLPGRLTRWKGQAVLIEALARLGHDRVRCLLVGDDQGRTGYRRELEDLVAARNLGGVVHIVGECNDMPAAYKLSDVVVSASTDPEAFGRVMVEAQAMGRPVVAANHGASAELLIPGETGWLVPPGDPDALAAALREALALDAAQREALADRAIRNARRLFARETMCAATLDVYREVLVEVGAAADPVAA